MFSWVMEYPESVFAFALSLFCLVQAIWFKKDFFSPITVYVFSQSITLGISYLRLDAAMTDFKPKTWMIWILGMLSFCTGSFLVKLFAKSKRIPCDIAQPMPPRNYNWRLHLVFSFLAFFAFAIGVFGVVQMAGNLLVFTPDPAKWMSKDINYGYYALLVSSGPLSVLLFGVAAFKKFNDDRIVRIISKFMVLFTIALNFCAYPNRTALFFNVGFLIILMNFLYKRISPVVISVFLVLAIAAFVGISSVRAQYGGSDVQGKAMDVVMKLPYMYVANNYWNLDYAVNSPPDREIHPHTYGIDFFHGIFEYARVSGSFRQSFRWDDAFNERVQKVYGSAVRHGAYPFVPQAVRSVFAEAGGTLFVLHLLCRLVVLYVGLQAGHLLYLGNARVCRDDGLRLEIAEKEITSGCVCCGQSKRQVAG